jgi:molecular chaperone Hsp33
MKAKDTQQRFMFEHANIRGEIAHLNETYTTIMQQHPYPPAVKKLLGEALVSCLLLAGSIKFEGDVSLQFHGDKRLPLLLVQCDDKLQVRAFAKYQEDGEAVDYTGAFLEGKMALIINQYKQTQTYESIVPIRSLSMSDNLTHYFAQSEQVASQVWLAVNEHSAAGMLLQLMPGQDTQQREEFWEYAVHLGQTISDDELLMLDNETILRRLYHETELRLYTARPVSFRCRCGVEKMKQILAVLGQEDVQQLLEEKGHVEVRCDFCNQQYLFDSIDVALLFRK